jgi:polysaccharide export outer membrane protein
VCGNPDTENIEVRETLTDMFFGKSFAIGSIATVALMVVSSPGWALPLSPGDRLRLFVPGEEGLPDAERFSATYEVNIDGTLNIPYLPRIQAQGRDVSDIEDQIERELIDRGFFRAGFLQNRLSLQIFEWAPIQVTVGGAVYDPGRVLINTGESKGRDLPAAIATVSGDYPTERFLTTAIRNVGGVTPNADVRNVRLIRGNQERVLDLSGAFTGAPVEDVPLIAGDQIIVPQLDRFQGELARPSQITLENIRVFLANQTSPGGGGGLLEDQELPYGSRMSQAVVAAGCAGGTQATNAKRRVVLLRTNRTTGETEVFDRSVEDLVNRVNDVEANPFLMREDSVVCYDSTVTNVASLFQTLGNILNPINLFRNIFFD